MDLFRSNNHIGSLYLLTINIGRRSEGILDKAKLEVRLGNILVINHFRWGSFIVLLGVISLESCVLSKFSLWNAIKGAFHFFGLD